MSMKAYQYAWSRPVTSTPAKLVLLAIADEIRNGTCEAFPGRDRLSRKTGMSLRQVTEAIGQLERDRFIVRSKRSRENGSRTSNRYELVGFAEWLAEQKTRKSEAGTKQKPSAENRTWPTAENESDAVVVEMNPCAENRHTHVRKTAIPEPEGEPIPYGGVVAGPSPAKVFWDSTLRLLSVRTGDPPNKFRPFVGRLVKQGRNDFTRLQAIIDAAEKAGTLDPVSYITRAANEQFGPLKQRPDPRAFDRGRWQKVAEAAIKFGEWSPEWGKPPGKAGCLMPTDMQTPELLASVNGHRMAS